MAPVIWGLGRCLATLLPVPHPPSPASWQEVASSWPGSLVGKSNFQEGRSWLCPLTSSALVSLDRDPQITKPSGWLHRGAELQLNFARSPGLPWASRLRLEQQPATQGAGGGTDPEPGSLGGSCAWVHSLCPLPGCGPGLLLCKLLPRTLGLALGGDQMEVPASWELGDFTGLGLGCQPRGLWRARVDSGELLAFGAVKGCQARWDLGPGHQDAGGSAQGCVPIAGRFACPVGSQWGVAKAISVGCDSSIWSQAL